jgi:hypothetical protein
LFKTASDEHLKLKKSRYQKNRSSLILKMSAYLTILYFYLISYILAHSNNNTIELTRVLDKLLTNYNKNIRPTFDKGIPTVVDINMSIKSIGPISSLTMSYRIDCYFRQGTLFVYRCIDF